LKAIILAAGQNSSSISLQEGAPTCSVDVKGRALLDWQIALLESLGVSDITVVVGRSFNIERNENINYLLNEEENSNVLYSLYTTLKKIPRKDEVVVLYSDIFYSAETLNTVLNSSNDISIGVNLSYKLDSTNLEIVNVNDDLTLNSIRKESSDLKSLGQFSGIMKLSPVGVENFFHNLKFLESHSDPDINIKSSWIGDFLTYLAGLGVQIKMVPIRSGWIEIGTNEDVEFLIDNEMFNPGLQLERTDWDVRAKGYNKLEWIKNPSLLDSMIDFCPPRTADSNVLDFGTGTGKVLMHYKERYSECGYFGIDANQAMLDKIDSSLGFNLFTCNVEEPITEIDANSIDLITARMVFHHIERIDKAVANCHNLLKPGGTLAICEGNPPDKYSEKWYTEMFKYKEKRNTFLVDDLVNILVYGGFENIETRIIMLKNMSLNNWVDNSGLPQKNLDIIKSMHREAPDYVKKAYNMREENGDIFMDWKFTVVKGQTPN